MKYNRLLKIIVITTIYTTLIAILVLPPENPISNILIRKKITIHGYPSNEKISSDCY